MSSAHSNSHAVTPIAPMSLTPRATKARANTYGQILKSSALIGGSSVVNIAMGIVRTKAMALLLGPAGIGLMGIYGSISNLVQSIVGMGISSSGVRQIAEAVGSGETGRIARTVAVLRRTSIFIGIFGAVLLAVFSRPVSVLTFGDSQHRGAVALLSFAVLFSLVSGGQGALIQGMRRIADMAKMGVLGALYGTLISVSLVYWLGEKGVVPSLIGIAAMSILTSWWYSRKVRIERVLVTASQVRQEATALLKLGFAFMASGFLTMGAAYAIRIIVLRRIGVEAAGLYQSAWALGGLYVGFILQAMGADFYPRLTAVSGDNAECNRLVNEQAQISLLMAGPGIIATLTFAPLVIALMYTSKFAGAVDILRWLCLGMTLQVVAWPMGFIVVAKNRQQIFLLTELAAAVVQVGLAWPCIGYFGLSGAGMAFFALYLWHGLLIYWVVRRLTGFQWSEANRKIGRIFLPLIGMVFCSFYLLPFWLATAAGSLAALLSGIYSLRALVNLVPLDRIPGPIRRLLGWTRLAPLKSPY
jgi:enterobacterial common antigen flippase